MAKKLAVDIKKIGQYAFIVGILIAIAVAFFELPRIWNLGLLIVVGIAIGLLNITVKETIPFLIAALVLIVSASVTALSLGAIPIVGLRLVMIWSNVLTIVSFAAIIVALKTVWALAENK